MIPKEWADDMAAFDAANARLDDAARELLPSISVIPGRARALLAEYAPAFRRQLETDVVALRVVLNSDFKELQTSLLVPGLRDIFRMMSLKAFKELKALILHPGGQLIAHAALFGQRVDDLYFPQDEGRGPTITAWLWDHQEQGCRYAIRLPKDGLDIWFKGKAASAGAAKTKIQSDVESFL